jgi:cytoskeletal protein CcmA (bactofilin family)
MSSEPQSTSTTESPNRDPEPPEVTTLLGHGSEFHGKLTFEGAVRIDGRFSGEIVSEGILVVGQEADIEADVVVRSLVVQGRISGSLTAQETLELRAPARVRGSLNAPQLSMEKGVVFDGTCEMSGEAQGEGSPAEPASAPSTAKSGSTEIRSKETGDAEGANHRGS